MRSAKKTTNQTTVRTIFFDASVHPMAVRALNGLAQISRNHLVPWPPVGAGLKVDDNAVA